MTNKTPKVSVIIPNYNHAIYLKERIESVLNQSYDNFELIILDDCSTDNSKDIIESYSNNPHLSNIVINEKNTRSPFKQWKKGIDMAKGEYIWIAESDDIASPQFLSILVSQLDNNPKTVLAFSHSYLIDSDGNILSGDLHDNSGNQITIHKGMVFAEKVMTTRNYIYNASMVVFRRASVQHISDDYLSYHSCGDWAFWMDFCQEGDLIEVCTQLNYFRQHNNKVTINARNTGEDWKEVGSLLSSFINKLSIKGIQLHIFRGKWTRDLYLSNNCDKISLIKKYPKVFNGTKIDIFLYRITRLIDKKYIY